MPMVYSAAHLQETFAYFTRTVWKPNALTQMCNLSGKDCKAMSGEGKDILS